MTTSSCFYLSTSENKNVESETVSSSQMRNFAAEQASAERGSPESDGAGPDKN